MSRIIKKALTFDDVTIKQKFTNIQSRSLVSISQQLGPYLINVPVMSANMNAVTNKEFAVALAKLGGIACLPRFMTPEENVQDFLFVHDQGLACAVSFGVFKTHNDKEYKRVKLLYEAGARVFVLDVAHGAQTSVADSYALAKRDYPDATFIVGNFASNEAVIEFCHYVRKNYYDLKEHCVPDGLKFGVGPGCLAKGTRVLMANGSYKNIEDILLHDQVINMNGLPVQVTAVKYQGKQIVTSYKNNIFYKNTMNTVGHRHYVGDYSSSKDINKNVMKKVLSQPTKSGESKLRWLESEAMNQTVLLMPNKIKFNIPNDFVLDLNEFAITRRDMNGLKKWDLVKPTYDFGYILGTFLGDGSACYSQKTNRLNKNKKKIKNTTGSLNWYFGLHETEITEKLVKALNKVFNVSAKISTKEKKNVLVVSVRNSTLSKFFTQFGKRENKSLTNKYLVNNTDYLKGLWDGIIDSDGSVDEKGQREGFTNISTNLMEEFSIVFYLINNYWPSITNKGKSIGNLKRAKIENIKDSFVLRSVKNPQYNQLENFQFNRLTFKDGYEEVDTYDIEVDCKTHSFIANNAIVHNSACSTRVKTGVGTPQLQVIMDAFDDLIPFLAEHYDKKPLIMSDGGKKVSGDICKALGAGADMVMLGSMLAATAEGPGDLYFKDEQGHYVEVKTEEEKEKNAKKKNLYKKYYGSASAEAYKEQGKNREYITAEGDSFFIPYKGSVEVPMKDIIGGLNSSMTYVGALNLSEYKHPRVEFIEGTQASFVEGTPHGKK